MADATPTGAALPFDRTTIAAQLRVIGDWLELDGERYRAKAYHTGADAFEGAEEAERLLREGRLTELAGIGDALAKQIGEIASTGQSSYLEKVRAGRPDALLAVPRAAGISAQKFMTLYDALAVKTLEELEAALASGAVAAIKGFGAKTAAKMTAAIAAYRDRGEAMTLDAADEIIEPIVSYLTSGEIRAEVIVVGARRRAESTIDRVELAAQTDNPAALLARFVAYPRASRIENVSDDRALLRLTNGLRVYLTVAPRASFGNVLVATTGPHDHVTQVQKRLAAAGRSFDEAFATEAALYAAASLPTIPAERRHDPAALATPQFDDLVTLADIAGMTHCHTVYSDGTATIEAMARAAEARGFRYLTITDHSPTASYAGGVDLDRLRRQWDEIADVQSRVGIRLLRGTESDILQAGALDYPDTILEQMDIVIASVHTRHKLDREQMTERLVTAMRHPLFKIWGHALGRLLLKREPFECDLERVLDAVAESRAAIEINADPYRLDLPAELIPAARARGIRFVISTDAHSVRALDNLPYGVAHARRGGLRRDEVLNTLPPEEFVRAVRPS